MFDLNYYNELTDFGKMCDTVISDVKMQGMKSTKDFLNKTDRKLKITSKKEKFMNDIMYFHNKHGPEYYKWYIAYFEKDKQYVNRHTEMCNTKVVCKKLVKPHHLS